MLFFDDHNGGPNIDPAFNGLTPDSRVRLEWFDDAEDKNLIYADYSIRDGRLTNETFHPLSLLVQLKFRNGDDKCMVRFGGNSRDPKLEELISKLKPLTKNKVSKEQLVLIIQKSINLYQKDVIAFHLKNYGLPVDKILKQHPDDSSNFEKYLNEFFADETNTKKKEELKKINKEDGYTPVWIVLMTLLSVVLLIIYIFSLLSSSKSFL